MASPPAFQGGYRIGAEPRAFRERFLRKPGREPESPQEVAELGAGPVGHGTIFPLPQRERGRRTPPIVFGKAAAG